MTKFKDVEVILISNRDASFLHPRCPSYGARYVGIATSCRDARRVAQDRGYTLKAKVAGCPVTVVQDRGDHYLVIAVSS